MATECKQGEVTLTYNTGTGGHPVALSPEQHELLQVLVQSLGEIKVVKQIKVIYEKVKK